MHFDGRECGHSIGPYGASGLGSGVGGRRALPHWTEAVCAGCSNDSKLAKCRVKYFCAHCGLFAKKVRRHANDNDDDAWRRIREEVWFRVSQRQCRANVMAVHVSAFRFVLLNNRALVFFSGKHVYVILYIKR